MIEKAHNLMSIDFDKGDKLRSIHTGMIVEFIEPIGSNGTFKGVVLEQSPNNRTSRFNYPVGLINNNFWINSFELVE